MREGCGEDSARLSEIEQLGQYHPNDRFRQMD
jgi:hypothetical protein